MRYFQERLGCKYQCVGEFLGGLAACESMEKANSHLCHTRLSVTNPSIWNHFTHHLKEHSYGTDLRNSLNRRQRSKCTGIQHRFPGTKHLRPSYLVTWKVWDDKFGLYDLFHPRLYIGNKFLRLESGIWKKREFSQNFLIEI